MAQELENLTQQVASTVQTEQLVVILLGRVIDFVTNNRDNPAALVALTDQLRVSIEALAAAAASTEAALNPPQP